MKDGSVKLGDLNVSKVFRKNMGYTQTGTPYYASPEVWNDKPYDTKSDIWSMGCVLYEMTALKPPFRAKNMEGLYKKVIEGNFIRIPSKFTNDLYKIIQILLQVKPEKRPSCAEILQNPIILKRIEFFKNYAGEDVSEDQALLKTIIFPKNLLVLPEKLPKPNYGNKSFNDKKKNINFCSIERSRNNKDLENIPSKSSKNIESCKEIKVKEKDVNKINNIIINDKIFNNNTDIVNQNFNPNIDDEIKNNLKMKNINIIKSISKRELPAIKHKFIKSENINLTSKNNVTKNNPYIFNSDLLLRKKLNNIYNILNKKDFLHKNKLNNLDSYNNKKNLNNNIYNINRINSIRRKINYADIHKENASSKIYNKIKLNPIKPIF
jgi:NIMA (never in mitosis gene a)-related kinase